MNELVKFRPMSWYVNIDQFPESLEPIWNYEKPEYTFMYRVINNLFKRSLWKWKR